MTRRWLLVLSVVLVGCQPPRATGVVESSRCVQDNEAVPLVVCTMAVRLENGSVVAVDSAGALPTGERVTVVHDRQGWHLR